MLLGKITAPDRQALALTAQASILANKDYLQKLFRNFKWPGLIRRLTDQGLITSESGFLRVPKNVRKQLNRNDALIRQIRH
jgi:hypothetical protein